MIDWDVFLVVYAGIVILAVLASWLTLTRIRDKQLAYSLVSLFAVVATEQIYYGTGRFWPELYQVLVWFAPVVMALKAAYCIALAAIVQRLLVHEGDKL